MPKDTTEFQLTSKQNQAIELMSGPASNILLYGGVRSAKTFIAVLAIVTRALMAPGSRHAILRFRFAHVKTSIVFDTFPKVMELKFPGYPYKINKSDWFVRFHNGSEVWFGGLDDKQRTEKILGTEFVTILLNEVSQITYPSCLIVQTRLAQICHYTVGDQQIEMRAKMYFDENPPSRGHWSHKLLIEKVDPETRRPLNNPEDYAFLQMNPADNRANLSPAFLKRLDNLPKRQRQRFRDGLFGSEGENALWTLKILEQSKVSDVPEMLRIVVAVDPSGATDDPDTTNDDIGIIVMGLGIDGIGYLLEDVTHKAGPATWGKVVADTYDRHEADRVIGESNYGGAMVEFVIKTAKPTISYKEVHASRSKMIRAEPVSALHETGKIKLVGDFPDLEDELLNATTTGYTGAKSPNRLDAFVFAVTELFPGMTKPKELVAEIYVPDQRMV